MAAIPLSTYQKVNLNRPTFLIALDLLYITNKTYFYPRKTKLGKPRVLDTVRKDDLDANTYVDIKTIRDSDGKFVPAGGLAYRRFRFSEVGVRKIPVPKERVHLHDILPQLNKLYGLQLTEEDVIDMVLIPQPCNIALRADSESLAFIGDSLVQQTPYLLDKLILPGFKEYSAQAA